MVKLAQWHRQWSQPDRTDSIWLLLLLLLLL
jgi:hypothetical protein